jgi:hypothetical protein
VSVLNELCARGASSLTLISCYQIHSYFQNDLWIYRDYISSRVLFFLIFLLHPWAGGVAGIDVNVRSFGSCHRPVLTTGNFLRQRGMDKIDYKQEG